MPDTGVTREYWFNVENITAAPDGVERMVLAVNGSIPGPTIIADWGDEITVHVTNNMANNGSTIHWHGIRQNYTNVRNLFFFDLPPDIHHIQTPSSGCSYMNLDNVRN